MSISVSVTLLSGRGRLITLSPDCTVEELRLQAQLSLKVGLERLVTESGAVGTVGTVGSAHNGRESELFAQLEMLVNLKVSQSLSEELQP